MKRIAFTIAVCLVAAAGCRSEKRTSTDESSGGVGGGPRTNAREGVIDRLAHARCQARQRCGPKGTPITEHESYGECVDVARADLRGSFGAATCDAYDDAKIDACARTVAERACGPDNKLTDDCVESKLCRR
jgi:hypothetical protein